MSQREERQLHLFKSKRQRGVCVDYSPSEFQLHCAIADTLRRWITLGWIFTHLPLGEYRLPATAARLKRMGVMAGWADFILLAPDYWSQCPRPHFLEIKRRNGRLSNAQAAFAEWCKVNQCPFEVADSYEEAIAILQEWGALKTTVKVQ